MPGVPTQRYPYEVIDSYVLNGKGINGTATATLTIPQLPLYLNAVNAFRSRDKVIYRIIVELGVSTRTSDMTLIGLQFNAVKIQDFSQMNTADQEQLTLVAPTRALVEGFDSIGAIPISTTYHQSVAEYVPSFPFLVPANIPLGFSAYFSTDGAALTYSIPCRITTTFDYADQVRVPPEQMYQGATG